MLSVVGRYLRASRFIPVILVLSLILSACAATAATPDPTPTLGPTTDPTPGVGIGGRLVVYSGRSEPLIQPVLDAFSLLYPDVEVLLKSGSNSELANALIEEANNPQADVFITTELMTIQALNEQGVLQSFRPPAAEVLPPEAIGENDSWVGLTRRARVIMYNTELVSAEEAPQSIFDLTDPQWRGQVAAAGSTNGSMQAQIAAMRQIAGDEATEEWLRQMLENEATFFGGHTDVRKAVGAGEFKLGLVNHYYYHLQKDEGSPVGIIYPDQGESQPGLITNLTAVGITAGARNLPAAQALVNFLLSEQGQRLFAELNYEYPLLGGVMLRPDVAPLEEYRLADVDIARAAAEIEATFALIERVGLP